MRKLATQNLKVVLFGTSLLAFALAGVPRAIAPNASGTPPLRALIVGGGPSPDYNQVSIANNVRYVRRLLPAGTSYQTLFASGDPKQEMVLEDTTQLSAHDSVVRLLLDGRNASLSSSRYAKPNLGGGMDGPNSFDRIDDAFTKLKEQNNAGPLPLLLYFTGHGSPGRGKGPAYENNYYDLWDEDTLSVSELAGYIAQLPPKVPVTLVMVQCYSGAFGNLLFQDGNPKGSLVARDIVGFFATTKDCVAAGCTSEVNEAEYRDFTSYFFAALSGKDRVGRRVTGADYNGDGRVGMDEAYYYSVAHDESIDIPVATSDVFLRRYVPMNDAQVYKATYAELESWATPAQKAALRELSTRLRLFGDHRLGRTFYNLYHQFPGKGVRENEGTPEVESYATYKAQLEFEKAWTAESARLRRRYPGLTSSKSPGYSALRKQVVAVLNQEVKAGQWDKLKNAYQSVYSSFSADEKAQIAQSRLVRFTRLGKTIVLAHQLRGSKNEALKARYNHLLKLEAGSPLPTQPILTQVKK